MKNYNTPEIKMLSLSSHEDILNGSDIGSRGLVGGGLYDGFGDNSLEGVWEW